MGELKVLRGKKNYKDVGRVIAYNGETGDQIKNPIFIANVNQI